MARCFSRVLDHSHGFEFCLAAPHNRATRASVHLISHLIGTNIAHYEITRRLGQGGMGEVYQATDSRLGRDVAIKVLPDAFARDADRVVRLEREARVLASLNHPRIGTIYGLEESSGRSFLVMELVAGETLADRIARGSVPIDEALTIAHQIDRKSVV